MEENRYISPEARESIFKRDLYTCRYCGNTAPPFHIDHVYPFSKGGETSIENLVTACADCNMGKHNSVGVWPKPIGHFVSKKSHIPNTPYILVITMFGVAMMMNAAMMAKEGYGTVSDAMFLIGVAASIFSLTYLFTKSWK